MKPIRDPIKPVDSGIRFRRRKLVDGVRDLLFPPRCAGCDDLCPVSLRSTEETIFCPVCRTAWESARADGALAGQAFALTDGGVSTPVYLIPYRSGRTDGVPERVIYRIKHQGDPRVFRFVASGLAPRVQAAVNEAREAAMAENVLTACDGTHAIPLFTYPPRRRAAVNEDGFDQAARLARALAEVCGGEFAPLLRRTRRPGAGREQKKLGADDRQINAAHAYALRRHADQRVRGRIVVLCDDLCTTGATLGTCAQRLLHAGAAAVIPVTVARTIDRRVD